MYSIVLVAAMTTTADADGFGKRRNGCNGGSVTVGCYGYGGVPSYPGSGCYGGIPSYPGSGCYGAIPYQPACGGATCGGTACGAMPAPTPACCGAPGGYFPGGYPAGGMAYPPGVVIPPAGGTLPPAGGMGTPTPMPGGTDVERTPLPKKPETTGPEKIPAKPDKP